MIGKFPFITFFRSIRFKAQFLEARKRLALAGNIVSSVSLYGHGGVVEVWTEVTKELLNERHKRNSDMLLCREYLQNDAL